MNILSLNCGSATVKYGLFRRTDEGPAETRRGNLALENGYRELIDRILASLPAPPDAVGHRVVHGGDRFRKTVRIDGDVANEIEKLCELAPLHNPPALEGINATKKLGVPMAAVFDTAFHDSLPPEARTYALPKEISETYGIRRYGFHGISHQYVTQRYARETGNPEPTLISLHLGNGCSATAAKKGRSVDTSMGFSPMEGLVMGTRSGDIDPAIPFHLIRRGHEPDEIEKMLLHESGLLGLTGSHDMKTLLERNDPASRLAVDLFCHRIRKTIGAYLAVLEGKTEAILFTGGIGENSPEIRRRVCSGLGWAGIELNESRNRRAPGRISTDGSKTHVHVIPTDEQRLIAEETARLFTPG